MMVLKYHVQKLMHVAIYYFFSISKIEKCMASLDYAIQHTPDDAILYRERKVRDQNAEFFHNMTTL